MKSLCFTVNPIEENCYLLWDETTLDAAIIDCGAYEESEKERIRQQISRNHLQLRYLLQTHTHFDHIYGLPTFAKEYSIAGLQPELKRSVSKNICQSVIDITFVGIYAEISESRVSIIGRAVKLPPQNSS